DLGEEADDPLGRVVDTGEPADLGEGEAHRGRATRPVEVGDRGVGGAAAVLDEEVDHALGGDRLQRRVDASLEALGRLGGQLVPTGRAGHRHRVEVRGLDEDVGGRRADL